MDMLRAHSVVSFLVPQMNWRDAGALVWGMLGKIPHDSPIRRAALIVSAEYCREVALESKDRMQRYPDDPNAKYNATEYMRLSDEYTMQVAAMDEAERASNPPHPALDLSRHAAGYTDDRTSVDIGTHG